MLHRMAESEPASFNCPQCGVRYTVIRVEMPPDADDEEIMCISCGASLQAREDRLALKYFLIEAFAGPRPRRR
jgi:transcription elongation factor Elf1